MNFEIIEIVLSINNSGFVFLARLHKNVATEYIVFRTKERKRDRSDLVESQKYIRYMYEMHL